MSADNIIRIWEKDLEWFVEEQSFEGRTITDLGGWADLESAVRCANEYMKENEVEYGLDIRL